MKPSTHGRAEITETFRDRMKARRRAKRQSLFAVATKIGVHPSTLLRWESEAKTISTYDLERWKRALNAS